jgi:hypothetical protein
MPIARISLAIFLLLGSLGIWAQEYLSGAERMKKLSDFVGTWDLVGTVQWPPEVAGDTLHGKVKVFWTLNKSALEFRAEAKGDMPGGNHMEAMGILQYDSEATYANRAYTAFFTMESDGRMLPLRGNFSGKSLVLKGTALGSEGVPVQITVTGAKQKTIQVTVLDKVKNFPLLRLVMTKR